MKWVLALFAGITLWLGGVAWWIASGAPQDASDTADVAIVLGAAVEGDMPSPVFAARIDHAVTLFRNGRIKRIIFTGARSPDDSASEAQTAKTYANKRGVPAETILIEERSLTTHQNLVEARRLMRDNGLSKALIVSDPLHLRRALMMAYGLGIEARASAATKTRYQSWRTKAPFLLREVYFVHHHWVFGE